MWLGILLPALFLWFIVSYFRNSNDKFLYQWRRGAGWLALCVAPITVVAVLARMIGDGGVEWDQAGAIVGAPFHWPVLMGGQTVISIFEENVKDWTGHRKDTLLDNVGVFVLMMTIQVAVLSFFVAKRFQKGKTWRDPLVRGLGILMAINAFLGMEWPWYGT